jgi:hypothetical protein
MKLIEEMFAFVSEDGDCEGVVALQGRDGMWMPLVGADMARVDSIRVVAQKIANSTGRRLRLLRFTVRHELEVIEPVRSKTAD